MPHVHNVPPAPPAGSPTIDDVQTTLRSLIDILQSNVALLEIVKQRLAVALPPADIVRQVRDILVDFQKLLEDEVLIGTPGEAGFIARKADLDRRLIEVSLRAPVQPRPG